MAYCTAQSPRRRLRRQCFRIDWPQPTCGAALLWSRQQPLHITLFSDDEQRQHFPLPFESAAEEDFAAASAHRKDIVIDLRRCGTFVGLAHVL